MLQKGTAPCELIEILRSRGVNEKSLKIIENEEFDGESFLELSEFDLTQKLNFKLGTVKKLSKIIKRVRLSMFRILPFHGLAKTNDWSSLKIDFCLCSVEVLVNPTF